MMLLFWFIAVVAFRSYQAFQRRRDPYSLFLYSGILTGIFSILLHGVTDFNMQIGANGLYLFLMLGLAVSASHTRVHEDGKQTLLRNMSDFSGKRFAPVVSFAALFLCVIFYSGCLLGTFLYSEIRPIPLSSAMPREDLLSVRDTLARASLFDPLDPEYHYKGALTEALSSNIPGALREYEAAVASQLPRTASISRVLGFSTGKGAKLRLPMPISGQGSPGTKETLMRANATPHCS